MADFGYSQTSHNSILDGLEGGAGEWVLLENLQLCYKRGVSMKMENGVPKVLALGCVRIVAVGRRVGY